MRPCNGCGKCCVKYTEGAGGAGLGCATERDLERLRERPDVLAWIPHMPPDLWIHPATGEEAMRCPWLRKLLNRTVYKCRIHDVRPDICRNYPLDKEQMRNDGCEMLEPGDWELPDKAFNEQLRVMRNTASKF